MQQEGVENKAFDLQGRLEAHRNLEAKLGWTGTFADYFKLVSKDPSLVRLSHARIYDVIRSAGVEEKPDGIVKYKFFDEEIFGLEKSLQQVADYFASGAKRLEVRKRILLLMGPVGGGKSTLVNLLKRGLEKYSRAEEGALYAIDGCPMHEEPLHLLPEELRPEVESSLGIHIEGDLCPRCRSMLSDDFQKVAENVPVKRLAISEKKRVGIGTFSPSDPKSQDISELTGSIDLSTVGEFGTESDPRAYRFDGELNIANRGLMEFVEMLKSDEKFLYHLLTLSQEQSIKTGRFAMIYADEVVVSHSNEAEYNNFIANKRNEALLDRLIVVKFPYNLRVSDEQRIYQKLLKESQVTNVHIAPNTLRVAAMFAVLTRLAEPKKSGMTLMKKLKLYDGLDVEDFTQKDVKEMQSEADREGMDGIGPRAIINAISKIVAKEGTDCINPIDVLRSIKDAVDNNDYTPEMKGKLLNLIAETRQEYDEWAKTEVLRAFVYSFEDSAKTLLDNYLDNVEAFCNKTKIKDPITDEDVEPDDKLMRSIEEQIGVSENAKKAFREEILIRLSTLARKGQRFEYTSHDRLREAIEKKLFADLRDVVKITTSTKTPDAEQLKRVNDVAVRLTSKHSYCGICSNELLKYVGALLNR